MITPNYAVTDVMRGSGIRAVPVAEEANNLVMRLVPLWQSPPVNDDSRRASKRPARVVIW